MFRGLREFTNFAGAPFRFDITRRDDGDKQGCFGELLQDFVSEDVIPRKLGVSPNLSLATDSHTQHGRERSVKPGDPTLLTFGQRLVIKVRVTDKEMFFKRHFESRLTELQ